MSEEDDKTAQRGVQSVTGAFEGGGRTGMVGKEVGKASDAKIIDTKKDVKRGVFG